MPLASLAKFTKEFYMEYGRMVRSPLYVIKAHDTGYPTYADAIRIAKKGSAGQKAAWIERIDGHWAVIPLIHCGSAIEPNQSRYSLTTALLLRTDKKIHTAYMSVVLECDLGRRSDACACHAGGAKTTYILPISNPGNNCFIEFEADEGNETYMLERGLRLAFPACYQYHMYTGSAHPIVLLHVVYEA